MYIDVDIYIYIYIYEYVSLYRCGGWGELRRSSYANFQCCLIVR